MTLLPPWVKPSWIEDPQGNLYPWEQALLLTSNDGSITLAYTDQPAPNDPAGVGATQIDLSAAGGGDDWAELPLLVGWMDWITDPNMVIDIGYWNDEIPGYGIQVPVVPIEDGYTANLQVTQVGTAAADTYIKFWANYLANPSLDDILDYFTAAVSAFTMDGENTLQLSIGLAQGNSNGPDDNGSYYISGWNTDATQGDAFTSDGTGITVNSNTVIAVNFQLTPVGKD